MAPERNTRTLDWREELSSISPRLERLPRQAQLAVQTVVANFRAEDALRPRLDRAA